MSIWPVRACHVNFKQMASASEENCAAASSNNRRARP